MSVFRYLDASTKHISKLDADLLTHAASEAGPHPFTVYDYAEGWFIPLPDDIGTWALEGGFSPDLIRLTAHARALNCSILCLDCDGDVIEGLPHHEW